MLPPSQGTLAGTVLTDLFERFDHGDNVWHAPIASLIDDLTAAQAAWRPSPERHSIWQLVRHMAFWRTYVLARLFDQPIPDIDAANWSEPPSYDEDQWQAELARYRQVHQQLLETVASLTTERLLAATPSPRKRQWYHLVVGILAHDSYHAGQIAYLRALQGLPPAK